MPIHLGGLFRRIFGRRAGRIDACAIARVAVEADGVVLVAADMTSAALGAPVARLAVGAPRLECCLAGSPATALVWHVNQLLKRSDGKESERLFAGTARADEDTRISQPLAPHADQQYACSCTGNRLTPILVSRSYPRRVS